MLSVVLMPLSRSGRGDSGQANATSRAIGREHCHPGKRASVQPGHRPTDPNTVNTPRKNRGPTQFVQPTHVKQEGHSSFVAKKEWPQLGQS